MQNTPEIPLDLCQVLEEEFDSIESLRNPSFVPVREDWLFHDGHVLGGFVEELRNAGKRWTDAHGDSPAPSGNALRNVRDLRLYLAFKYPDLLKETGAKFLETLNRVLLEANIPEDSTFTKQRFEHLAVSEKLRDLMQLGWEGEKIMFRAGPGVSDTQEPARWSDLVLFRRLLLEEAFRNQIRPVYDIRLEAVFKKVHHPDQKRAALCFSGGGIRSGTFALGVVQSLARRDLLPEFDYLSTVSGGGYTGGWLSAWIHRHRDGLEGVVGELKGESSGSKLEPEPEPLQHLREYSSFVTPRTGLLSADTWTFVIIYIRNLLLNWVVLIPLLASVLMIPRVANAVILIEQPDWRMLWKLLALGGVGLSLLAKGRTFWLTLAAAAFAALVVYVTGGGGWLSTPEQIKGLFLVAGTLAGGYALAYMRLSRPSNTGTIRPGSLWDRSRSQRSFLWMCMLPLTLSGVLLTTFWAWFRHSAGHSTAKVVTCVGFSLDATQSGQCLRLPGLGPVGEFYAFLLYGLTLGFLGWFLYILLAGLSWVRLPKKIRPRLKAGVESMKRLLARGAKGARRRRAYRRWLKLRLRRGAESLREEIKLLPYKLFGIVKDLLGELVITVAASGIGSILLYAAATKIPAFYDPVAYPVGFDQFSDKAVPRMLPYTEWNSAELYTWLGFPAYLFVFFLGITLFVGLTSRRSDKSPSYMRKRRRGEFARQGGRAQLLDWLGSPFDRFFVEDEDREWLARASAWVFIVMGCWAVLGGLVIYGPLLVVALGAWFAGAGGASALTSLLGGKSSKTPGNSKGEGPRGLLSTLGLNLIVVAAVVFFACIVIAVSLLTGMVVAWLATYFPVFPTWLVNALGGVEWLNEFQGQYPFRSTENVFRVLHFPSWRYLLILALVLQVVGQGFSRLINLNKFSLHAGYRDRIIRAFLGASRLRGERRENPFTGFDPRDNLNMEEMRPWLLRESDFYGPPDKVPPGALRRFVEELSQAPSKMAKAHESKQAEKSKQADKSVQAGATATTAQTEEERLRARRVSVAAFMRECIRQTGGESERYFKDPSCSIDNNASFRSALFADLNNILQSYDLKVIADGGQPADAARNAVGDPGVVMGNRRVLHEVIGDCINHPPRPYRLLHVVNMALNLVGGDKLAWQQRRAESFTSTPLHSGSLFVGYRRTRDYGGKNGITLGTAVATSGAAASSNMGYFSPSVFVTFVLTFFNARLGWWLGNPGVHGADTFFRSHPEKALSPIIDEAFGLTDDRNPYVLLSDGGHFENLGLYEMVLRRCRYIFVVDGSADPAGSYDDLGGAVRKIRIDFGIDIKFNRAFRILSRPESLDKKKGAYCAVGDILYGDADGPRGKDDDAKKARADLTGKLVYIKPAVYGDEPRDVFNYTQGHEEFPHESTADQFFDEPQFESHRMLGFYILEKLLDKAKEKNADGDVKAFVKWLDETAEPAAPEPSRESFAIEISPDKVVVHAGSNGGAREEADAEQKGGG
jgi:hypothetical protein